MVLTQIMIQGIVIKKELEPFVMMGGEVILQDKVRVVIMEGSTTGFTRNNE